MSSSPKRTNTRRMHKLRQDFYLEGKRQDADPETRPLSVCWMCKERIDYDAEPNTTPESHNLDHYVAVSERPELQEDPGNFRHSHTLCNQERSNRAPSLGLGEPVPDWWG